MFSDALDHFCVHEDLVEGDKIWNISPYFHGFIPDIIAGLLASSNFPQPKFDAKRILIWFLMKFVPQFVQNLKGTI